MKKSKTIWYLDRKYIYTSDLKKLGFYNLELKAYMIYKKLGTNLEIENMLPVEVPIFYNLEMKILKATHV